MTFKKLALVFCVLCAVIICSCDEFEYTFENKSSCSIQISLSEPYKNTNSSGEQSTTSTFVIYASSSYGSNNKRTVYVKNSDVDFTWTTSDPKDNSKVSCTINGSKATFTNQ
jgi:hypothetical protein